MGQYADRIANLELVQQLKKSAGRDDIPATDITKLEAMVFEVADIVGPLLSRIPQTFKQYTEHDIGHCCNIIYLMGKFIPKSTLERLNGLELTMLILVALLHDLGMFITEAEKADAEKSDNYKHFLSSHPDRASAMVEAFEAKNLYRATAIQDALLAEYFRRLHPERAAILIQKHLKDKLVFRDRDVSQYIVQVCESHAWGVHESLDPRRPEKAVNRLDTNRPIYGVPVNLQYLACCLRLADIMDFDRSRTPIAVFKNLEFTESKSWDEWNKHLQISGWSINEYEVMYVAECTHPVFYVAVMDFLDWIDVELRECRHLLVKEAAKNIAARYLLHLPPIVDRWKIEMSDKQYLAGAFRFQLDYERILQLLMDKSLYPDPSLCLRELLQNSLDACRNREAIAKSKGAAAIYSPRIVVWDYSDDKKNPRIIFQDNGVGMSRRIVENYFMRVGRSYYRSIEFDAERQRLKGAGIELEACSQFGIGILSCFMIADRFEVETYRVGNKPLHITIEGPAKYFIVKLLDEPPRTDFPSTPSSDKKDGPPSYPGTRITLYLRPDTKIDVYQVLDQFAVNAEYDLFVYHGNITKPNVVTRLRWQLQNIRLKDFEDVAGEVDFSWRDDRDWVLEEIYDTNPDLAADLKDVLVPSRIPFEKYAFSCHLHGFAWFWLLRGDDGGVCPKRGYLSITNKLQLNGLPSFISSLTHTEKIRSKLKIKAFLKAIQTHLTKNADKLSQSKAYANFSQFFSKRAFDDFVRKWYDLSIKERRTLCKSLEYFESNFHEWTKIKGITKHLLLGARGLSNWSNQSIDFNFDIISLNALPQSFALHGISLPAGLMKWDSMNGYARKLRLLAIPGGMRIDVRGPNVPTPAANRLFVESQEAKKVVVPFGRAALRHAFELAYQNIDKPGWQKWIDNFIGSIKVLLFWPEVIWHEFAFLEQYVKYKVYHNSKDIYMSKDQIVQNFGRWVPLLSKYNKDGLYPYNNDMAEILCSFRAKRKRKRGVWEVDMESLMMPKGETLEEIIDSWHDEMKKK